MLSAGRRVGLEQQPHPSPRLEMTESILYALFILSNFKNICSVFMIDLSNISFYWLFFIIFCLFNVLIMESISSQIISPLIIC